MDIKHILEKIKQIESKQTLMEAPEKHQETPKVVKKTTTQINESKSNSIYATLVREFGYDLNEADPAPAQKPGMLDKVGNFFKQNAADYEKRQAADAAARSPEGMAAAKANLTPSQLKWLGGAEASPEILARMPKPQPGEMTAKQQAYADSVDAADAELGAAMKAGAQAAKEKEYADSVDAADAELGAAMAANAQAATPNANAGVNAQGQNVTMPDGTNSETGEKAPVQAAAPLQLPPGAEPEPGMTVAGAEKKPAAGGAAQPAKPAASGGYTIKPGDNLTKIAKANNTTIDAIMKANPQIKDPNKIMAGAQLTLPTSGGAAQPAGAGSGRGSAGMPQATPGDGVAVATGQGVKGTTSATPSQADVRRVDNAIAAKQAASTAQPGAGQKGPTKAAAAGQDPSNPLNKPAGGAAQPAGGAAQPAGGAPNPVTDPAGYKKYMNDRLMAAAKAKNQPAGSAAQPATAGQTTNTSSQQNVSGTLKMGKPEGPIQFNGKTVQPGDPEYSAASQALIRSQQRAQQARTQMATRGAANTGPITQGGVADGVYEESLSRIRQLAGM